MTKKKSSNATFVDPSDFVKEIDIANKAAAAAASASNS